MDWSQDENNLEEGDVTDWLEGDEKLWQWEEVSKDETITVRKMESRSLQVEGAEKVPELRRKRRRRRRRKKKKKKNKVVGWSTEKMEERTQNGAMEVRHSGRKEHRVEKCEEQN